MDTIFITCQCGQKFTTPEYRLRQGRGKFCSRKCQYAFMPHPKRGKHILHKENPTSFKKGNEPWNKGINGYPTTKRTGLRQVQAWNKGMKGIHLSPDSEFKPGQTAGEAHANWKGDDVGYAGLHKWVRQHKERKMVCDTCSTKGPTQFANLDHQYTRDLSTWGELCQPCHTAYDKKKGWGAVARRFGKVVHV